MKCQCRVLAEKIKEWCSHFANQTEHCIFYLYYHLNGPCSDELCCNWFWNWIKLHCHPVHALGSKSAVLLNNWITNHFECIKALYIPLVYISLLKFVFTKLQTSAFATLHIHTISSKIRRHIWNTRRHFETCNSVCVCVCACSVLSQRGPGDLERNIFVKRVVKPSLSLPRGL